MRVRLATRDVTWAILAFGLAVLAITGWEAFQRDWSMWLLTPAAAVVLLLAAWPFLLGWRPFTPAARRWSNCERCGTQWRPHDEKSFACPACAGAA